MLMYCNADVLERLLFYGKPFAGALGKNKVDAILAHLLEPKCSIHRFIQR